MRLRRCAVLWLEPREVARFDLAALLAGGTGVSSRMQWHAHAPQLDAAVEVDPEDVQLLGSLGADDWLEGGPLRERHGAGRIRRLLRAGLLVGRGKAWAAGREADERVRAQHWHGLSAIAHAGSRWHGTDAMQDLREAGEDTPRGLRERFGAPPPMTVDRGDPARRIGLARPARTAFDALLDTRAVCRNFDTARPLPAPEFARLLERVFGARAQVHAAEDLDVMKRTSPSGGAMHPTEAWLLVQRVDGIPPGLYHYRPLEHAVQAMPWRGDADALRALALRAVAGQDYLADAHVLVALAPRFARNFWKYRNHAKAYRVCVLDAGHLSQTLLLSAADRGLGAFVTAAINEVDIERAFGLEGIVDGPLAVCGFGLRAEAMSVYELDPNHAAWPRRGRVTPK
jgi:putative peptide maturation dehydrogenase